MRVFLAIGLLFLASPAIAYDVGQSILATPTVTTGTVAGTGKILMHGQDYITSNTPIVYVFYSGRTASGKTPPTQVYVSEHDLRTTLSQTYTDGYSATLSRVPIMETFEVWNYSSYTVALLPNVGVQTPGRGSWNANETTPTMNTTYAFLTKLGPYGGSNLPTHATWNVMNPYDNWAFPLWNVGVIIVPGTQYETPATLRDEDFTSTTFTIKGR